MSGSIGGWAASLWSAERSMVLTKEKPVESS
jgi:hypothetical protein